MMDRRFAILTVLVLWASACSPAPEPAPSAVPAAELAGDIVTVRNVMIASMLDASGAADAIASATLSTKLMGTVVEVHVLEGDRVRAGDVLLRIDDRDVVARAAQAAAALASADAMRAEAELNAQRIRALFADEAAARAQVDAAETALTRANAAVEAARAAAAELGALRDYALVRAPFAGIVTSRMVDPGSFATPGAPLLVIQDASRLRVSVSAPPDAAASLHRGDPVSARIEGIAADARIEGVIPSAGSMYRINAIVDNARDRHLPGSAAILALPLGTRAALLVPASAIEREGDLTGVRVRSDDGVQLRWVRLGRASGDSIEVLSGLRDGERIVVPTPVAGGR
jgi:RND family efflux transporter MFP subunit